MGREWYFSWGSKSSSKKRGTTKSGGGDGGSDKRSSTPQVAAAVAASGGCMNAVLHMFDFNHLQLCLHPNNSSYLEDDPIRLKGVEAPRNSLEYSIVEDEKDKYLNISMDIQIETNRRDKGLKLVQAPRAKVEDTLSQSSCSPTSARTPTLVARLMGLDILPESSNTTPRSSSSNSHSHSHISSSTPPSRTRKTRTKSSNNNQMESSRPSCSSTSPHRLSLQINKEKSIVKEMELSRPSCSAINTKRKEGRKYDDENKSPGYYAKQIMKQVKETVSRRVGADITNTIAQRDVRRDEHLLSTTPPIKPKKSRKDVSLSTSPKLIKNSETSNKITEKISKFDIQEKGDTLTMSKRGENEQKVSLKKFNGVTKPSSKMATRVNSCEFIRNKKDEQFVRSSTRVNNNNNNNNSSTEKKCKRMPLPYSKHAPKLVENKECSSKVKVSNLVNSKSTTMNTTTKLSHFPSQPAYERALHAPVCTRTSTNTSTSAAEFQYISKILKCTGIDRDTPICFTRWFSASNPLNPSTFNTIEATHYPTIEKPENSSNRKLIFHLVDEILADILKQYIEIKPYQKYNYQKQQQINGFQLVKTLCTKLKSFPSKDCQTLQDIDSLVEQDMPRFGETSNLIALEAGSEAIVTEIEGDIVDSLVQEMCMFLLRK